jgi:glucans biosynthesis protein C
MSTTSLALSNLRAIVILVVLGFHSVLAYLGSHTATRQRFDAPPYEWQAFPIIDNARWFGFDLFCAWNDVCLMSLMFFLSGLFVWPSLVRKQSWNFLWDRLLRLGLPLVLAVYLLVPVALYPVYRVSAADPSLAEYWRQFQALPFWPCGPQWFLWQLLAFNVAAAGIHQIAPRWGDTLGRLAASGRAHPLRFALVLIAASAIAYVPLALIYSPWSWFQYGPFAFQHSRPLHNAVYFLAGVAVGARGLDRGLLAPDGILVQRWAIALGGAFAGFLCWIIPTAAIMQLGEGAPLWLQVTANLGFVLCCAGGCLAALAACLRFATRRSPMLDSLSASAYGMYLVHYPFVVWMQYALLDLALPALVKASLVFVIAVAASWAATAAMRSAPIGSRLIGANRRALAKAP